MRSDTFAGVVGFGSGPATVSPVVVDPEANSLWGFDTWGTDHDDGGGAGG